MIHFVLKEKKIGKKSAVSAIVTGVFVATKKNDRIKVAMGVSVAPETFGATDNNYNYDANHVLKGRSFEANQLREKINQFTKQHDILENYYIISGIVPRREEFEFRLIELLSKENLIQKKNTIDFEDLGKHYFDEFIINQIVKEQEELNNGIASVKQSTIKTHKAVYGHLINYQTYTKKRLFVEDIKVKTLLDIVDTSNAIAIGQITIKNVFKNPNTARSKEGYSTNFTNNLLAQFKAFLRKIDTDEIELSINLADARLKRKQAKNAKKVYFKEDLLQKIYDHKPLINRTSRARDYILLGSSFGMRYQSVQKLYGQQPQKIVCKNGDEFEVVVNQADKTGVTILSPIFAPAKEVFARNGNKFPKIFLQNYLSKALRDLFAEIGVNEEVAINEWVHGKGIVSSMRPLREIITSHDCRKTFVTNLKQLGANPSIVRSMTHEGVEDGSSSFDVYDSGDAKDRAIAFYAATKNLDSIFFRY